MTASCRSRVRLEVSTITGGCVARTVPSSGIVTAASASISSRNASKSSSARSISSIRQHRRSRPRMLERPKQRPADQVVGAEQVLLAQLAPARLRQADAEQLARIVPLVQRLGGVDPLVALQADQRRVEHRRKRLAGLGLADAGLAFEQQRLRQPEAQEHRGGQALVDQVVDGRQPLPDVSTSGASRRISPEASPVTSITAAASRGPASPPTRARGCTGVSM